MFALSPPGTRARMVYENQDGDNSARTVDVIRWSHARNGHTYLRAWCHLRREERTFRADRILSWDAAGAVRPAEWRVPAWTPAPAVAPVLAPAYAPSAVPTVSSGPVTPAGVAARRTQSRRRDKHAFGGMLGLLWYPGCALIVAAIIRGVSAPAPAPIPAWKPAWAPAIPVTVKVTRTPPAAPVLTVKPTPAPVATVPQLRQERFTAITHVDDSRVFKLYESADSDHSGGLSFGEIQAFQSSLYRHYRYLSNGTALRPDQFLDEGGGDCEDWALMAAGMLRYWGFKPWLVTYAGASGDGHAVCFLQVPQPPAIVGFITLDSPAELSGETLPAGVYVPIDYDDVGSLSSAVHPGWTLKSAWVPESVYGMIM